MRDYKNENNQKMLWFAGTRQNIRMINGFCLDVYKGENV